MLKGDLAIFSLGEILQSLAINNHSGTLRIRAPQGSVKLVHFLNGEIVHYSEEPPDRKAVRVGEVLLKRGHITQEQLQTAIARQADSHALLGDILLKNGAVTVEALRGAVESEIREELYDLFLLKEGTFEFQIDYTPEGSVASIPKAVHVSINTNSIIMEGMRQLDEWRMIHDAIPTFDAIYIRSDLSENATDSEAIVLLELLDGYTPLRALFNRHPWTRFECCSLLRRLLETGEARALTLPELLAQAEERTAQKQWLQVAQFLHYAAQLSTDDPELFKRLGDARCAAAQHQDGAEAYGQALKLYHDAGLFQEATALFTKLLDVGTPTEADLERVFRSYLALQNVKKATTIGNQVVFLLQKRGDFDQAASVLEAVAALNPKDLDLKIQAAICLDKAGNTPRAVAELEHVAEQLEKHKKYSDLLKVLKLHVSMSPDRHDIKQKIVTVQALQERQERRKKYGLSITGCGVIALLVASVLPIIYELKAREYYSFATRLEQSALSTQDYTQAKEAYETLLKSYSLSTRVALAKVALERIADQEKSFLLQLESDEAARKRLEAQRLSMTRDSIERRIQEAREAEGRDDIEAAVEIYRGILSGGQEYSLSGLLVPVWISTDPPGAMVTLAGDAEGPTPFVYRYLPKGPIELELSRPGCKPKKLTFAPLEKARLQVQLERIPGQGLSGLRHTFQPAVMSEHLLVLAARDSTLGVLDTATGSFLWRRPLGNFGDRLSNLGVHASSVLVGTVNGETALLDIDSGKPRWVARVPGCVYASPAISPDAAWVAVATTGGACFILKASSGDIVSKVTTENEVLASPILRPNQLIVGSTDNYLYFCSVPDAAPERLVELSGDIARDMAIEANWLVAVTEDGAVHAVDIERRQRLWTTSFQEELTTSPGITGPCVAVGTAAGQVLTMDLETGKALLKVQVSKEPVAGLTTRKGLVYVTCVNGTVACVDPASGRLVWSCSGLSPIHVPPVVDGDRLLVPCQDGKIEIFEALD